jgi:hypothetical protein
MNEIGQAINLLDGAQGSAGKNRVLNSNFSVWQRGTSFTALTASAPTADRWYINPGVSGGSGAVTRQTTSDTTNLPFIQYCARVQRTASNANTNQFYFANSFESVNSIPLAGKTVTLSYYARAGANYSAASGALTGSVYTGTGTDQGFITAGYTGQAQPVTSTVTLTTTWQRFTVTGTLAATATEVSVVFQNTPVGTAGVNDYYEITGVQLEAANTASPYAPNGATFAAELSACYRYYQNINDNSYILSVSGNSTTMQVPTASRMRTTPTITTNMTNANYGSVWQFAQAGVSASTKTGTVTIGFNNVGASPNIPVRFNGATYSPIPNSWESLAGATFEASAEL